MKMVVSSTLKLALVLVTVGLIGPSAEADILIHPDRTDITAAEDFLDGMIVVEVLNCPPWEDFLYVSTDTGQTWENLGSGTSSDTGLTKAFSFAADGDSSSFYMLYDSEEEIPRTLELYRFDREGSHGHFVNIAPEGINAHEFAGCTDHLGPEHWIYICVVDTDPPLPSEALMFLRSTDYGNDWFPPVDSYPLVVREPYLTAGAGSHIYFTGRTGARGDSLIVWTNRNRLEPGYWQFDWIDTDGDQIESPIVAASFSPDDSLTTVWCAYSRNRNNSGNWDIEFVYSTDGGTTWSEPFPLAASPDDAERFFDLKSWRGPNGDEVSIAYIASNGSENIIYWRSARAGQPAVWSEPVRMNQVNAAPGKRVRPKLCHLAGHPGFGVGVIYVAQDGSGCWWSTVYQGGQQEPEPAGRNGGSLLVTPRVGTGPFRIAGVESGRSLNLVDRSGRVVRKLLTAENGTLWDGRDGQGRFLPSGVYFVRLGDGAYQTRVVLLR
ncbi:MAG: sialidase family protein [candidate division WOR-3 bacterium]